jgi:Fe(3+) dicitrate transport protein
LGKTAHNLVGARAYQATTIRKQNGTGTTGSDFDLSVNPDYTRNIKFKTENIAFFAENQFLLIILVQHQEFVLNTLPLAVLVYLQNNGSNVNFDAAPIVRNKALFGLGLEYKFVTNIYANISQAYRPILFSDLTLLQLQM